MPEEYEQEELLQAAREFLHDWIRESDPKASRIFATSLRRVWTYLDGEQRAQLRAEGLQLISDGRAADELRRLPE